MLSDKNDLHMEMHSVFYSSEMYLKPCYDRFITQKIESATTTLKLPKTSLENCRTCTTQLISKIDCDKLENYENILACNKKYLACIVQSCSNGNMLVKIRQREPRCHSQTIIKDMDSDIICMEFMSPYDNILGLIDRNGTIYVVKILNGDDDNSSENLRTLLLCKLIIPSDDQDFSIFGNSTYKITWIPWKYKLNFENKLLPEHDNKQMILMYGSNGCCIIYKFKIDLVDLKISYIDVPQESLVQSVYIQNLHDGIISSAYISPDGDYISTSSMDGKCSIWKIRFTLPNEIVSDMHPESELIPFSRSDSIIMHHWCDTRMFSSHDEISYWSVLVVVSVNNEIKLYDSSNMSLVQTIVLKPSSDQSINSKLILRPLIQSFGSKLVLSTNKNHLLIFNVRMKIEPDTSNEDTNQWMVINPFISEVCTMPFTFDVLDFVLYPEVYINRNLVGDGTFNSNKNKSLRMYFVDQKNLYSADFFIQNTNRSNSRNRANLPYWVSSYYYPKNKSMDEFDISKYGIPEDLEKISSDPIQYQDTFFPTDGKSGFINNDPKMAVSHNNDLLSLSQHEIDGGLSIYDSALYHTAMADFSSQYLEDNDSKLVNTPLKKKDLSVSNESCTANNIPITASGDYSYPHNLLSDTSVDETLDCSKKVVTLDESGQHNLSNQSLSDIQLLVSNLLDSKLDRFELTLNNRLEYIEQQLSCDRSISQCRCTTLSKAEHCSQSSGKLSKAYSINSTTVNNKVDSMETFLTRSFDVQNTSINDIVGRVSDNVKNIITSQLVSLENRLVDSLFSKVDKICQRMFVDVDKTFQSGTKEYLDTLQRHLSCHEQKVLRYQDRYHKNSVLSNDTITTISTGMDQLERNTKELIKSNIDNLKTDLLNNLISAVGELNDQQTNVIASLMEETTINVNDATTSTKSENNSYQNILGMRRKRINDPLNDARRLAMNGEFVKALSIALQNDYRDFCLELCLSHEPSTLVKDPEICLSMCELYKLVKILSEDLTVNQDQKISYLQEILLLFDVAEYRNDVGFIECIQLLLNNFEWYQPKLDKSKSKIVRMLIIICKRYLQ